MKCEYCGRVGVGEECRGCGAPLPPFQYDQSALMNSFLPRIPGGRINDASLQQIADQRMYSNSPLGSLVPGFLDGFLMSRRK